MISTRQTNNQKTIGEEETPPILKSPMKMSHHDEPDPKALLRLCSHPNNYLINQSFYIKLFYIDFNPYQPNSAGLD